MADLECDVAVIGSCMIDLICYAERLPQPGETLHGTKFLIGQGGKGANQCVAAAKLGAKSALIARLGNDTFGKEYKQILSSHGVYTNHVNLTDGFSSGMAQITVSDKGDNQIVIVSGANSQLNISDVKAARTLLASSKVVLFQFETPLSTTIQALEYIKDNFKGLITIVNAAPAIKADPKIYTLCDIFCVNETEAEIMGDLPVMSIEDSKKAVKIFIEKGCRTVIITMGANGVVFGSVGTEPAHVAVKKVTAVDTTGAGDAFLGALAFYSSKFEHLSLEEKIIRSCQVATWSVQKEGTQSSYPTAAEYF